MIPDYYLPDQTEMHIGGFERCISSKNKNDGCIIMLYRIHRKHQLGSIFHAGKCVFCQRIFPIIDWDQGKASDIAESIRGIINSAPYYHYIFHPMIPNDLSLKLIDDRFNIYHTFPGKHLGDYKICNIYQEKYLWESYIALELHGDVAVIPCKECPGCGSFIIHSNIALSEEFDGLIKKKTKSQNNTSISYYVYERTKQDKFNYRWRIPKTSKRWKRNTVGDENESIEFNYQQILERTYELVEEARERGYVEAPQISNQNIRYYQDIPILFRPQTFLVRVDVMYCVSERHSLQDVICLVNISTDTGTMAVEIPATYCLNCRKYYILESEYQKYREQGSLLCRVVYCDYYTYYNDYCCDNFESFEEESILHVMGYNVREYDGPTAEERREILRDVVDRHILTRGEICTHLRRLIRLRENNPNMAAACNKWQADIDYICNYKTNDLERVEADVIIKNRYHYR